LTSDDVLFAQALGNDRGADANNRGLQVERGVVSLHQKVRVGPEAPEASPRRVLEEVAAARARPAVPAGARLVVELQRRDVIVVQGGSGLSRSR
jgi:hypothetical protein